MANQTSPRKFFGKAIPLSGAEREIVGALLDARLSPPPAAKLPVGLHERTLATDAWKRLAIGEIKEARRLILTESENYSALPMPTADGTTPKDAAELMLLAKRNARSALVERTKEFHAMQRAIRRFNVPMAVCNFVADAAARVGEWLNLSAEGTAQFIGIAEKFGTKIQSVAPDVSGVQQPPEGWEALSDGDEAVIESAAAVAGPAYLPVPLSRLERELIGLDGATSAQSAPSAPTAAEIAESNGDRG